MRNGRAGRARGCADRRMQHALEKGMCGMKRCGARALKRVRACARAAGGTARSKHQPLLDVGPGGLWASGP